MLDEYVELDTPDRRGLRLAGNYTLDKVLYFYYVNISLNATASLLQLFLMWYMKRKKELKLNLYIKCVLLQTIYQFTYDSSLAFSYICKPEKGASVSHRLCTGMLFVGGFTFGGFGAALFSMMILVSATFVVLRNHEPTQRQQYIASGLVHLFMISWAVPNIIGGYYAGEDPARFGELLVNYNYARLFIIGMTLAIMALLLFKFRQFAPTAEARMRSPLYHLIRKLIYYPVIQVICRVGTLVYNVSYRSSIDKYPADADNTQFFVLLLFVVTAPLAGGLSFLVFLYMTPKSKTNLGNMLLCRCPTAAASAEPEVPPVDALEKKKRPSSKRHRPQSTKETPVGAGGVFAERDHRDMSAQKRQSTPPQVLGLDEDLGLGLGGLADYSLREEDTEYSYGESDEYAESGAAGYEGEGLEAEAEFYRLSVMDEEQLTLELIAAATTVETQTRQRNSVRIDASNGGIANTDTAGAPKAKSLSIRGTALAPVMESMQENPMRACQSQRQSQSHQNPFPL
jgi:hypothetical protein